MLAQRPIHQIAGNKNGAGDEGVQQVRAFHSVSLSLLYGAGTKMRLSVFQWR